MDLKIYLAGGMSDLPYEEQNKWRENIVNSLEYSRDGNRYDCNICNPVKYYNFKNPRHETEKEVMRFDLHKVRNSDLIIVNFNEPKSLGTMAEIAVAYEHSIPIIGLNTKEKNLHPWQVEMCDRVFTEVDTLVEHIIDFYLN